ncbi:transposable element Tcb1 transposase [Trichonephila clavipes]|nr:transposable element Tcb1 transposase [Trichonephila clavipes]
MDGCTYMKSHDSNTVQPITMKIGMYTHFQKLSTERKMLISGSQSELKRMQFAAEVDGNDKRIRIWYKQGTGNQPQNITEYQSFRGGSIMVWAGISLEYRIDLHIFKRGSVTAVRYRDEDLEPIVRLYVAVVGPTFVLSDDNTRPHRADIVDDYLESEGIARMASPEYSPDHNPIENLWDALGRAVSSRFPPPVTLIELKTALQEKWRLLNSAVVDHLIESMVKRLPPGGATSYQLLHLLINHPVANVATKNDVNLALSPTFRYVSIESPL